MKTRSYNQVKTAKRRASLTAENLLDDPDRADEFDEMSVEEYAELRGITIQNPNQGEKKMAKSLREQLDEANARILELESERDDVLDALGLEVIDDDEEEDHLDDDE